MFKKLYAISNKNCSSFLHECLNDEIDIVDYPVLYTLDEARRILKKYKSCTNNTMSSCNYMIYKAYDMQFEADSFSQE